MGWQSVIGQERAKRILRRSIEEHRIAHAYLFWGPAGVGKDALALEFARILLCEREGTEACGECIHCKRMDGLQHPNLHLIFALPVKKSDDSEVNGEKTQPKITEIVRGQIEEKSRNPYFQIAVPGAASINIGSVREIRKQSALTSFGGGRKIFLILGAEKMNEASANALLKVLEEPLGDTVFLLTTSRREQLPLTIVSRCQSIRCEPLGEKEIEEALEQREQSQRERARLIARLSNGDYSRALELLAEDVLGRRLGALEFLRRTVAGKTMAVHETIEEYTTSGDRKGAEQFLLLLLLWFRDALVVKEGNEDGVINQDYREAVKAVARQYEFAAIASSIDVVEKSLELLRKNVYLPLVFLSLSVHLKRIFDDGRHI